MNRNYNVNNGNPFKNLKASAVNEVMNNGKATVPASVYGERFSFHSELEENIIRDFSWDTNKN